MGVVDLVDVRKIRQEVRNIEVDSFVLAGRFFEVDEEFLHFEVGPVLACVVSVASISPWRN